MKRVLSLFLSCIFVLGVCFSTPIVASATGEGESTQTTLVGTEFGETSKYKILSEGDVDTPGTCALIKYGGTATNTTISGSVLCDDVPYTITQISTGAFSENSTVEEITISATVTRIEAGAFDDCVKLASIVYVGHNIEWENVFEGELTGNINVTKNAENCSGEEIVYVADGNKITVKCNGCSEKFGAITLEDPELPEGAESLIYDGAAKEAIVKVEGITGLEEIPAISYVDEGSNPITPINAGTYTATLTIGNETAKKEFTIEPKVVSATLGYGGEQQGGLVYNGKEHFLTVFFGEEQLFEGDHYTIKYLSNKDAGEIIATITLTEGGNYAFLDGETLTYSQTINSGINIEKVTPEVTIVKAENLVLTNEEQPLLTTANTTFGTLKFSLEDTEDETKWSTTIPTAVATGTYTVYYKVVGDSNVNDLAQHSVEVTISAHEHLWSYEAGVESATITATCSGEGYCEYKTSFVTITLEKPELPEGATALVYDGSAKEANVTVSVENTGINPVVVYKTENAELVEGECINAGDYTASITLGEGDKAKSVSVEFTIEKSPATFTAPTANDLTYTGGEQALVKAGEVTNGTMQYSLDNQTWNNDIPTEVNAGEYTVYYKVVGDKNHTDAEVKSVPVEIKKAPLTITAKDVKVIKNSEKPVLSEFVVGDGLITGDKVESVQLETTLSNTETVGDYNITVSNAVIKREAVDVTYNYEITYVNGTLSVVLCETHSWKDGVCEVCKTACEHKAWTEGKCDVCKTECKHATWKDGVCTTCNTECEHEFGDPELTKSPTCNAAGELTWVCSICKHTKVTNENTGGDGKTHDWSGDYVVTKEATCVSEGVETKICKNGCGEKTTRQIAIDTEAHVMGEWVTTEQTCVADGKKVRSCTLGCGATETEVIKADNESHKLPDEWTVTKEANCVEDGEKIKACLNEGCTYVAKESIPADGKSHNLGEWEVTIPAKCTVKGEVTQYCQNGDCTHKVTASLKPDGKTHSFAKDFTVIEATCITAGSKFKACENEGCKEVAEKTEIAINPDAHKNVETINVKQPTCEEKGYTGDEHCNDCKKTFEPGIEVDALGHTESDWIVDKEATFTEDGARHTACTVCNKELKKEVIAKLTLATPVAKAYNKTSSIKVKWTDVENALTYNVYRSDFINNDWTKWKKIGTVKQGVGEFSDKNVVAGKQYKYTVKAYNGDYKSSIKTSNKLTFIAPIKPALTITTTGIILKWDTVLGADKYVVYRSQLVDGKWSDWKKLSTVKDGKTSTTDTTAESGVTYKYSVRAYVGSSYTERKSSKTIVFLAQPTLKISNTEAGIKGSWETINGATGYVITRSEYSDSDKKFIATVKLGTASSTAKSFTDKTAKEGVKYKYTITAISDSYSSVASSGKVLRRLAQPTVTIENANGAIKGKWTQVTGATKYTVYRSELVDGKWTSWKSLGTASSTAKSFTDKTVKSGINYKYTVKAINGGSKSSVSASNNVVFLTRPEPKAVNSIYGVKVNWSVITGAESYIVYRKEYVNKQWTEWQQIGTSEVNSYIDSTAVSGVKYKYTIHAVNGESLSARKASSSLLYVATPTATVAATETALQISWGQIGGATKYVVYRQVLGADGKWSASTKIASLKGVLAFTDTTAEAGNTYRYKVVAYNGKVKSSSNVTDGVLLPKAQ